MNSRRAFIAFIGSVAAEWVLAAAGRQGAPPVIGFLRSASLADAKHLITAFQHGLRETGFVDGQNVRIEYRSADSRHARLPSIVQELIALPVDLIVANHIAALPAKAATTKIPIVFASGSDPLRDGLVERLNRPGRLADRPYCTTRARHGLWQSPARHTCGTLGAISIRQ